MPFPDQSFDNNELVESSDHAISQSAHTSAETEITQPLNHQTDEALPPESIIEVEADTTLDIDETDNTTELPDISDGFDNSNVTSQLNPDDVPALKVHHCKQGLSATAIRDLGRVRDTNQDNVFSLLTYLPYDTTDMSMGLFLVADGMGGHEGGEIASRLAISVVVDQVLSHLVKPMMQGEMRESLQSLMVSAMQHANRAIWEHAQTIGSDMGTTCTAALMLGSSLYVAHVGDSRLYLFDGENLRVLTNDHSMVGRLIQLAYLDPADANKHPLRNQLYRTVGQQPEIEVDFIYEPLGSTTHLLLCSDGLWGMVSDEHIVEALTHSVWSQDMCHELIALANLAGGEDNISAIIVTLPVME